MSARNTAAELDTQVPAAPLELTFTLFTKDQGPLTKKIALAADGTLDQDKSACIMVDGDAERVRVAGLPGLAQLIEGLTVSQALALGGLRVDLPDRVRVTTKKRLANGKARPDLIARIGANIHYQGPAAALVDYDTKGMPAAVRVTLKEHGGFWDALVAVLPVLAGVERLVRSSTSAGLVRTDTGKPVPGGDGVHLYVMVRDGTDIERFLRALHNRCWLAGLGWFVVSRCGALLDRSIVDRMVGQASRLIFESGPILEPPLQQDAAARRPVCTPGAVLDTAAACPPLTVVEQSSLEELKARERERLAPEVARARAAFITRQAQKLASRTGLPLAAARIIIRQQCDGILRPDVALVFDDPDLAGCTVGDVLVDPERFEGATLADPVEGLDDGPCKAMIMRRADGSLWIHSYSHGHTIYELRHDAASVRRALEAVAAADVVTVLAELIVQADLDAVEAAALRHRAQELSGAGLRTINAVVKAAQQRHAAASAKAARVRRVAQRQDPRPQIRAPGPSDPWRPEMATLNEVIGAVASAVPPVRNIDGDLTRVCKRPIADLHAFTDANEPEESTK